MRKQRERLEDIADPSSRWRDQRSPIEKMPDLAIILKCDHSLIGLKYSSQAVKQCALAGSGAPEQDGDARVDLELSVELKIVAARESLADAGMQARGAPGVCRFIHRLPALPRSKDRWFADSRRTQLRESR